MSGWSSYRVREAGRKDERSIRELVREESTHARIVTRRIHEERVGMPKQDPFANEDGRDEDGRLEESN